MQIFRDQDANLSYLENRKIAVIGYGNQGRAQARNLRDSGLDVLIGNQLDEYAQLAREDGFEPLLIPQAVETAQIVMLLIPDEVTPEVYQQQVLPHLHPGDVLVFASGYNLAFEQIALPKDVDVILVAPRMIGAGVRDLYLQGRGFPSFIAVEQDISGDAHQIALALAKGIGSTRYGVVQVTFQQEAELDLFTEQCFGPAFGNVLTSAVDLLIEQGYPPEAVLLELYMSGELAYTFQKMADVGIIAQSSLHSRTSQYGSLTRGMRFMIPEIRQRMQEGLEEIRSGEFAREWQAEQEQGAATLDLIKEAARSLPLHLYEQELLRITGSGKAENAPAVKPQQVEEISAPAYQGGSQIDAGAEPRRKTGYRRFFDRFRGSGDTERTAEGMHAGQFIRVLDKFLEACQTDERLVQFAKENLVCLQYKIEEPQVDFYMQFGNGQVKTGFGASDQESELALMMTGQVLDAVFSRRMNPMRAAISGKMRFKGDTRLAMSVQKIQDDLCRLYLLARSNFVVND